MQRRRHLADVLPSEIATFEVEPYISLYDYAIDMITIQDKSFWWGQLFKLFPGTFGRSHQWIIRTLHQQDFEKLTPDLTITLVMLGFHRIMPYDVKQRLIQRGSSRYEDTLILILTVDYDTTDFARFVDNYTEDLEVKGMREVLDFAQAMALKQQLPVS